MGDEEGGGGAWLEEVVAVFDGPCDLVDCLPVLMSGKSYNNVGIEIWEGFGTTQCGLCHVVKFLERERSGVVVVEAEVSLKEAEVEYIPVGVEFTGPSLEGPESVGLRHACMDDVDSDSVGLLLEEVWIGDKGVVEVEDCGVVVVSSD